MADCPYKSISAETTFEVDLHDLQALVGELLPLSKQVEARLEKAGLAARAVVVKLKYHGFRIVTRRRTLPYLLTSDTDLRREAERLLRGLTLKTGVRLLGVGAEGLVSAADTAVPQTFLFPT